jgi:hypothetical protein
MRSADTERVREKEDWRRRKSKKDDGNIILETGREHPRSQGRVAGVSLPPLQASRSAMLMCD